MKPKFNLYQLTIAKNNYSCYVIATDPTTAQNKLEELLNKADWWFSGSRKVVEIKLIARELGYFPENRPSFPENLNCLIDAR